jgi:hypothetical protein
MWKKGNKTMLIKMIDGGLISYKDDSYCYGGCPTCDYGSEYITEIDIELTHYKIHIRTNQMYEYVLSEGQMMRLFLSAYNAIQEMTEKEFIDWLKEQICQIVSADDIKVALADRVLEKFDVRDVTC